MEWTYFPSFYFWEKLPNKCFAKIKVLNTIIFYIKWWQFLANSLQYTASVTDQVRGLVKVETNFQEELSFLCHHLDCLKWTESRLPYAYEPPSGLFKIDSQYHTFLNTICLWTVLQTFYGWCQKLWYNPNQFKTHEGGRLSGGTQKKSGYGCVTGNLTTTW